MADAGSPEATAAAMEVLDVGPCHSAYQMGFLIGERFSGLIRSRVAGDLVLNHQLLPFASTPRGERLVEALKSANAGYYPRYWDEISGTAAGCGVPLLHILLLNFRKELLPFLSDDDCSDVLIVSDRTAIAAHNEDANVALVGHTYLLRVVLPTGVSFTAYTYAGELPTCAFGFNSRGLAFTLNSVPPAKEEIAAGGIARNFVSRDLLEADSLPDAIQRVCRPMVSTGHSYNLIDVPSRRILNVETASGGRFSSCEVGAAPFFHANMYLHLEVKQARDENSLSRQRRAAALLRSDSLSQALLVLGDAADEKYPIFMTVLFDMDKRKMTIFRGNPVNNDEEHVADI